jgi:hypothetical protein
MNFFPESDFVSVTISFLKASLCFVRPVRDSPAGASSSASLTHSLTHATPDPVQCSASSVESSDEEFPYDLRHRFPLDQALEMLWRWLHRR